MKISIMFLMALFLTMAVGVDARAVDEKFSKQRLDQILAPIALYPDDLLSNVLMASTYPLDVVEAERWRKDPANAKLTGAALVDALKSKNWDPSIKALVQFPDVLTMMSDQIDWIQNLGDAFVAQQDEVMNEIQRLRSRADASGHLKSNSQQRVTHDDGAYIIRPANPDTVYVPVYEPTVVYGPWWYPDFPPYYWGYPGAVFTDGFFWGATGVAIATGIWGWNHWDWHNRRIDIDVNRWNRIDANRRHVKNNVWKHDTRHRGHVSRDAKDVNRTNVERRLHNTDHSALKNKKPRGAQARHKGQHYSKARGGKSKSLQKRGTRGAKKAVRRSHSRGARARSSHVRQKSFRAHRRARRGGIRRRR